MHRPARLPLVARRFDQPEDGLQLAEKKAVVGFVVAFPGESIVGGAAGGAHSRVAPLSASTSRPESLGNDVVRPETAVVNARRSRSALQREAEFVLERRRDVVEGSRAIRKPVRELCEGILQRPQKSRSLPRLSLLAT